MAPAKTEPTIIIQVNKQREGYIFDLRLRSRVWLETNYPGRDRVSTVFIGLDKKAEFGQLSETVLRHVLPLITGLSLDELKTSGGFRLFNPVTNEELTNQSLAYV